MNWGLDFFACLTSTASALGLIVLYLVTGKHAGLFLLPWYVRSGFIGTAIVFVYRAADFVKLSSASHRVMGHADVFAVLAGVVLSYTIGSLAVCLYLRTIAKRRVARQLGIEPIPLHL